MKRLLVILIQGIACCISANAEALSVEQILTEALECAKRYQQIRPDLGMTFAVTRISEKLNKSGEITEHEESTHETLPIGKFIFERLIQKNGKPLTDKELNKELERERKFREKVARGEDPIPEERRGPEFDERLISKYDFVLEKVETLEGRDNYVLSFRPKKEDLPVETRMDLALNKSEGKIWVDAETFEISRATWELREPVKLWWGLVGSISKMAGQVDRTRHDSGVWHNKFLHLSLSMRIFFARINRTIRAQWQPVEGEILADKSAVSIAR